VYLQHKPDMNEQTIVLLFLKAPVRGTVKTRLASALGSAASLDLARCFILDTVGLLTGTGLPIRICYAPPGEKETVAALLPLQKDLVPQEGKDLGERMENAFRRAFSDGFSRAVLLGSDIPDLPAEIVEHACAALGSADAVFGPAKDGGYYLIGSTRSGFCPDLFSAVPWSTPEVLAVTLQKARAAGLTIHLLPEWSDVDSADDLRELVERNRAAPFGASRTMAYFTKGEGF
jgi:rSAM/selenodomain-associated transferase 1